MLPSETDVCFIWFKKTNKQTPQPKTPPNHWLDQMGKSHRGLYHVQEISNMILIPLQLWQPAALYIHSYILRLNKPRFLNPTHASRCGDTTGTATSLQEVSAMPGELLLLPSFLFMTERVRQHFRSPVKDLHFI